MLTDFRLPRLARTFREPVFWVWLLSTVVGFAFWWIAPLVYTNDSGGYIEDARALLGVKDAHYAYWRTPGFPLLLALTGVATRSTLHVLVIAHLLMGILIPILIYYALVWIDRQMAVVASMVCVASLVPFVFVAYIMPTQLFSFTVVLMLYVASRYLATKRPCYLYVQAAACFVVVMARPQGSYLYVVAFAAGFLFDRRDFWHWIAALGLLLLSQYAYMAARPYFVSSITASPIVLIPAGEGRNLLPGDDGLFRRALVMVRSNLYQEAMFFENILVDPAKRRELSLAIVTQHLLNGDLAGARTEALRIQDEETRDQALAQVIREYWRAGDPINATNLTREIRDRRLHADLAASRGRGALLIPPAADLPPGEGPARLYYVEGLDLTNTSGKMLLYPVLEARHLAPNALIQPENGPASARLAALLEIYLAAFPTHYAHDPQLAARRPRDAALYMLTEGLPRQYHWNIWTMLDYILGPERADTLSKRVYIEFLRHHPWTMAKLYMGTMFQGLYPIEIYSFMGMLSAGLPTHPRIGASAHFEAEIVKSERNLALYLKLHQVYSRGYWWLHWAIALLATVALPFSFSTGSPARTRLFLLLWAVVLHQVAVGGLTAGVIFAYTSHSFLLLAMASGVGTYSVGLRLSALASKTTVPENSGRQHPAE